jgi:hypothetical protein
MNTLNQKTLSENSFSFFNSQKSHAKEISHQRLERFVDKKSLEQLCDTTWENLGS